MTFPHFFRTPAGRRFQPTLSARPALPDSLRPLTFTFAGLRLRRRALAVSVDAAGRVSLETDRPWLSRG